jgi:hypothetical protein
MRNSYLECYLHDYHRVAVHLSTLECDKMVPQILRVQEKNYRYTVSKGPIILSQSEVIVSPFNPKEPSDLDLALLKVGGFHESLKVEISLYLFKAGKMFLARGSDEYTGRFKHVLFIWEIPTEPDADESVNFEKLVSDILEQAVLNGIKSIAIPFFIHRTIGPKEQLEIMVKCIDNFHTRNLEARVEVDIIFPNEELSQEALAE